MANKKKIVISAVASVVLVAAVVAVAVGVTRNRPTSSAPAAAGDGELHSSMKAIQAICKPTDFKETCESSLKEANVQSSEPKDLVKAGFDMAIEKLKFAVTNTTLIKAAEKDPMLQKALDNCGQLMEFAIDDLKTSLSSIGEFDLTKLDDIADNVKMWLSASITYQETCLDGFSGTNGTTATKMKKLLQTSSELTRDLLAIMSEMSTVFKKYDFGALLNRKLLSEEDLPEWMEEGGRKLLDVGGVQADAVVAQDGSGKFKTITEALATVPLKSAKPFVIHIKEGVYKEQVTVDKKMWNVVMIGDGPDKTKITGSLNFVDGTPTFKTATVAVMGEGFMAKGIGFENSAGPEKHQAVALRVQSDRAIFYNCRMDGYQDTLYFHTYRQFYRDCTISGTIDFLFGNAAAVFQNCKLVVRKPMDNQRNIITAQGRKDRREPTGVVIHNCTVEAESAYAAVKDKSPTYLGRPWKEYSRTFYVQTDLGDVIHPDGWLPWMGEFALNTCFYAEYENRGASADQSKRVKWRGIKKLTPARAELFTVDRFIGGSLWLKDKAVPFSAGF